MPSPAEKLAAEKKAPYRRTYSAHICTIAKVRARLGLSLRDVQHGTGLSNAFISQVENGSDISLTNARQLCAFFEMTIDELWPRTFAAPDIPKKRNKKANQSSSDKALHKQRAKQ